MPAAAPTELAPDCHFAIVIPTTLGNLSNIADAIVKSTQLSAKLLAPLPTAWSPARVAPPRGSPGNLPPPLFLQQNDSNTSLYVTSFFEDFDLFAVPFASSGHTWLHILLATLVVVAMMIIIIFGNALVIIAVQADKSLKGIQNYFIVSLAVADLLVGLTIMPLSLAVELMGKWIFGQIACNLWLGGDVLLCTASILNLCMISIDRYWSVTLAGQYTARVRKHRVTVMIVLVWILSTLISLPPIVGWARKHSADDECLLMDDLWYIIYSTCGSFYAPLVVMIVVYIRIFVIARRTARKSAFTLTKQLQKKRGAPTTAAQLKVALTAVTYSGTDNQTQQTDVNHITATRNTLTVPDSPFAMRPSEKSTEQQPNNNNNNISPESPSPLYSPVNNRIDNNGTVTAGNRIALSEQSSFRQESVRKPDVPSTGRISQMFRRFLLAKYSNGSRRTSLRASEDGIVGLSLLSQHSQANSQDFKQNEIAPSLKATRARGKRKSRSMAAIGEHEEDGASFRSSRSGNVLSLTSPMQNKDCGIHQASSMLGNVAMSLAVIPRMTHVSASSLSTMSDLPQILATLTEQAVATTALKTPPQPANANVSQPQIDNTPSPPINNNINNNTTGESEHVNLLPQPPELSPSDNRPNSNGCENNNLVGDANASCNKQEPPLVHNNASSPLKPVPSIPPLSLAEEVERRKKRLAKERERRTTRILVIIMLSFVGCWFPFFTLYLVSSIIGFQVNPYVFATFFWLGYFNSALNPISYAAFNQDFRGAFKRLLRIK